MQDDMKEIIEHCPFKDFLNEWEEDYDDIIALACDYCSARDECIEDECTAKFERKLLKGMLKRR